MLFLIAILASTFCFSQTNLSGKVTEEDGEPVILGSVVLYQNGVIVTGTETDFDGNYLIQNLKPGTYDVEASYVGTATKKITDVAVFAGKSNALNIQMTGKIDIIYTGCGGHSNWPPLIEQDNTTSGATITNIARGKANFSFTTGL